MSWRRGARTATSAAGLNVPQPLPFLMQLMAAFTLDGDIWPPPAADPDAGTPMPSCDPDSPAWSIWQEITVTKSTVP